MIDIAKVKISMSNLIVSARKLNELTDSFTIQLKNIEDSINNLKLGVESEIEIPNLKLKTKFGYGRIESKWGFYIHEDTQYWHWLSAPRYLRIKVIEYIPLLFEQLEEDGIKLVENLKKATQVAQEFIDKINKK